MGRARRIAFGLLAAALWSTAFGSAAGPAAAAAALPVCRYADTSTHYAHLGDYYRSLVDTKYRLSSSYAPKDLVRVSRSGAPGAGSVRAIILPDLTAMFKAAKAAGAPFAVESAYRSYSYQVGTFARWVNKAGLTRARLASARPGHSEHQLGTSMDLTSPASFTGGHVRGVGKAPWEYADWGRTRAGAWLAQNSWKYGFILSYPKVGSPQKTCYKYEPWHFRYFGRQIAAEIHQSRLTAREWLWKSGATTTWIGGPSTGSPGAAPPLGETPDAAPRPDGETPDAPSTDTVASPGRPAAPATLWGEALIVASGVAAFMFMLSNLGRRPTRDGRRPTRSR